MTSPRPQLVGAYEILQDYECPTASVRVLSMTAPGKAIAGHAHRRSMQIYVAIEGVVLVDVDGVETRLEPYQALSVWPGSVHSAMPVGAHATLMNISIPPLAADDQAALPFAHEPPDMRLPRSVADIDEWSGPRR